MKMICPDTQKDIANASAKEILKFITDDIGDDYLIFWWMNLVMFQIRRK